MKHKEYLIIIISLLLLAYVLVVNHNSYISLLDANSKLMEVIYDERENATLMNEKWQEDYDKLLDDYGSLLAEYDQVTVKLNEMELPVYDFTLAEIDLLARCVEAEAGRGKDDSQKYITQVILNRLHSGKFPNSIEEVIYQKVKGVPQFSVAYNGMIDEREVEPETLSNVYYVIVHGIDLPDYVCYFYSSSITENWVNTLNVYDTIQGTVFAYE